MNPRPSSDPLPRLIAVEEFFADPAFANPSTSPHGESIAYLAPAYGRRNVPENQVHLHRAIERHFAAHLGGRRSDLTMP